MQKTARFTAFRFSSVYVKGHEGVFLLGTVLSIRVNADKISVFVPKKILAKKVLSCAIAVLSRVRLPVYRNQLFRIDDTEDR